MTHAEKLHQAERAVIEKAIAWHNVTAGPRFTSEHEDALDRAVKALVRLRAATCPTCGGTGSVETAVWPARCPAGCDNGRTRT